jgi:uncharacterized protein YbjT (DUF2867 family)
MPDLIYLVIGDEDDYAHLSVITTLLDAHYGVRVLAKSLQSVAAVRQRSLGARIFLGPAENETAIHLAASGCTGVVIMTTPSLSPEKVRTVFSSCRKVGVEHMICISAAKTNYYPSFPAMDVRSRVSQFWYNNWVKEAITKDTGFSCWTILRPGNFMSHFVSPDGDADRVFPELSCCGIFVSAYKKETKLTLFDPSDTGGVVRAILENPEQWNRMEVDLVGDIMTVGEALEILSTVEGQKITMLGYDSSLERLQPSISTTFRRRIKESQVLMNETSALGLDSLNITDLSIMGVKVKLKTWEDFLRGQKDGLRKESLKRLYH